MKVTSTLVGIFLFFFSLASAGFSQENTLVVYAQSSDGQLGRFSADYSNARSGSNASVILNAGEGIQIGQYEHPNIAEYRIFRGVLFFDTSALPETAQITSASLEIYGANKRVQCGDFKIRTIHGLSGYPHNPLILSDYNQANYSGNGGVLHTSSFYVGRYNEIPLNSDGVSWIERSGITHIVLRSTHDINAVAPQTNTPDYIKIYSADETQSDECRPRLVIHYTDAPQPNQPPLAPTLLAPAPGQSTGTHPAFSWTFEDPDSGDTQTAFQVLLNAEADFSGEDLGSGTVTSTICSWNVPDPLPIGTYYWKCRTYDGEDWGPFSTSTSFNVEDSQLLAPNHILIKSHGSGTVYLGWRWDGVAFGYNIYRSTNESGSFTKINDNPITESNGYLDNTITDGTTYWYMLRSTNAQGIESTDSIKTSITPDGSSNNQYVSVPGAAACGLNGIVKSGDLNGDGQTDHIIVGTDSAKTIHIQAVMSNGERLDASNHYPFIPGTAAYGGAPLRAPWTIWDLDGDGKAELIGLRYNTAETGWDLEIRNGMDPNQVKATARVTNITGQVVYIYKTIAIAYLDGITPTILYQDQHCYDNPMVFEAYQFSAPNQLIRTWSNIISRPTRGACHYIEVADFDEDGLDEAFFGAYGFDNDFTPIPINNWYDSSGYPIHSLNHPDGVHVADIRPDIPGLEVFFNVESPPGGIHLFQNNGNYVQRYDGGNWRLYLSPNASNHAHLGFTAELGGPDGKEMGVCHKSGGLQDAYVVSSTGQVLFSSPNIEGDGTEQHYRYAQYVISEGVDWNGDSINEVVLHPQSHDITGSVSPGSHSIRESNYSAGNLSFNQILQTIGAGKVYVMDVIGDYREEVILINPYTGLTVFTNVTPINQRKESPCSKRQYLQKHLWSGH